MSESLGWTATAAAMPVLNSADTPPLTIPAFPDSIKGPCSSARDAEDAKAQFAGPQQVLCIARRQTHLTGDRGSALVR